MAYLVDCTALNSVCPYFTMYPLEFPLSILAKESNKATWVLDPFCGRGTTNFAARLHGLNSVGFDSSPVASAIAAAKLAVCSVRSVAETAEMILNDAPDPVNVPTGEFWDAAYSETTLVQLCRLREELLRDCWSDERIAIRAIVMGALHGPRCKNMPSYCSNQCPRTFAPKPDYACRFWKCRDLRPPIVDVLALILRKAERYLQSKLPRVDGQILEQDSRSAGRVGDFQAKFSWIITSPPYYGMRTYIPDQWLRNWFVGGPSFVTYQHRPCDLAHTSPDEFSSQLKKVWINTARMAKSDARLVCRFGGINDRRNDPLEIAKNSFRDSGWTLTTVRPAGDAHDGRRQALQFGRGGGGHPRKEYDIYAVRN